MSENILHALSNQSAEAVDVASPSVVQVHGRRRPASGVVYADDVIVTTMRAIGREDGLHVRGGDGRELEAELAGWDPASTLAVLRAKGLGAPSARLAGTPARVGHLALAVARSWSNAVTASLGVVSVIGGPLATSRHRAIEQVIRTTAPMHDGFAGGAFINVEGHLVGITTASEIRGLGVVIPAAIAWKAAASVLEHGQLRRGFLGVAGQAVRLDNKEQASDRPERPASGVLVVTVAADSPAAAAGVIVGDVVTGLDGQPVRSPEDLLDLLMGDRVGRAVPLNVLRGGVARELSVTVSERPAVGRATR